MALVSVIVVIGFIAALVSIVLMTTVVNFKMRAVNERSKDTFYSAEQALDEINIGLQKYVSDSMSESYLEVMESYSEYAVTEGMTEAQKLEINEKRNQLLKVRYYEHLWECLEPAEGHHDEYDVKKLDDFLKDSTRWHGGDDGYGAIVVAVNEEDGSESKVGKLVTYENDGVVLKNLKVYYKDPSGFVSVIKTDIRLAYPEFNFNRSSEVPDIIYYSLIADEQAIIESGDDLTMKGKIYANQFSVDGRNIETSEGDEITIKYDLDLKDGSSFTTKENNILWAKNIVADSSSVSLKGTVSVANDVNLKGNASNFVVEGDFTGFGNSTTDSYKSSSILLNGKDSVVDVRNAGNFVLAGHSFAGTSDSEKMVVNNPDVKYSENARMKLKADKNDDIYLSESIAPKSDQLMYLVPASVIGVEKKEDGTGQSKYNKNPLTFEEYTDIALTNKDKYDEISNSIEIASLGGHDLNSFFATTGDVNTDDMIKRIFVRVSEENVGGGGLVYYYLNFDGKEAAARDYFSLYYANNKNSADKYMDFYIDKILMPESAAATVDVTGNYLKGYRDAADGFSEIQGSKLSSSMEISGLCEDKLKTYKLKVKCEDADIMNSFEEDEKELAAGNKHHKYFEDKLVDYKMGGTEGLAHFVDTCLTGTPVGDYSFESGGLGKINIIQDGKKVGILCKESGNAIAASEVTADTHLIVTEGDVTINNDFNGLVLSNGKVTFTSNVKNIVADPGAVRNVLLMGYKIDGVETKYITQIIPETVDYTYDDTEAKGDAANMTLGGMISYENWTKE